MPSLSPKLRRTALEVLGRDTLSKLINKFELAVHDRCSRAAHVNTLVRSRAIAFADVLSDLKRDELKAVCKALGMDASGREKEVLVSKYRRGPSPGSRKAENGSNGPLAHEEPSPARGFIRSPATPGTWHSAVRSAIEEDQLSLRAFVESQEIAWVALASADERLLQNLNTPQEVEAFRRRAQ